MIRTYSRISPRSEGWISASRPMYRTTCSTSTRASSSGRAGSEIPMNLRFTHLLALAMSFMALPNAAAAHPPTGIVVDRNGYVYFVDVISNVVFRVSRDGVVKRVAGTGEFTYGDGSAQAAKIADPHCLALDPSGILY